VKPNLCPPILVYPLASLFEVALNKESSANMMGGTKAMLPLYTGLEPLSTSGPSHLYNQDNCHVVKVVLVPSCLLSGIAIASLSWSMDVTAGRIRARQDQEQAEKTRAEVLLLVVFGLLGLIRRKNGPARRHSIARDKRGMAQEIRRGDRPLRPLRPCPETNSICEPTLSSAPFPKIRGPEE
jgi:hypothetical protein